MAEAWGYTPEAVADAAGFSEHQRKKLRVTAPAEALTGGSDLSLQPATATDTVEVTEPASTELSVDLYLGPLIEEELAAVQRFVDRQRGREVSMTATEVLLYATAYQPQPGEEELFTFRTLNKGGSYLQDLVRKAGWPETQQDSQNSQDSSSSSSSLESLASELDQIITNYNHTFEYEDRAALDRVVQDVLEHCLSPAVRAAKPREVWVLEMYETILDVFKPKQEPGA